MKYLLMFGWLLLWSLPSSALPDRLTEQLLADNAARMAAISALQQDRDPASLKLLQAWQQGQLYQDGQQLLLQVEGGYQRLDGTAIEAPQAEAIKLNNRLRQKLQLALAWRQLNSPQPAERLQALQSLTSQMTSTELPQLKIQLHQESDRQIKHALQLMIARLEITSPDPGIRLAALQRLSESDLAQDRDLLAQRAEQETLSEHRLAALKSQKTIEHKLLAGEILNHVFNGLSLGSILLLAALGLAITYGLLGVINMAHGELLMIGAYATFVVQSLFKQHLPGWFDYYLLAALPVAFLSAALVGLLMERLIIRHLYGRPLETLLATWGVSLLLIQSLRMIFGAQNVSVENAAWLSGNLQLMSNLTLPYNRLFILGFALAVLCLASLLLTKTRLGLFIRAVTQNRTMAACVGVSTARIDALAFGLGSGIAGLAGCALSQIGNVGPDLGQNYIIDSFMVVVLGGVGQLAGTVYAALGLGIFSKLLEPGIGAVLAKIAMLVAIVLFIQKRPQGLFALKGRQQEN